MPGYDSTSVFAGKCKGKSLKLMMNSARFVTLFQHFGRSWDQEEEDNKESRTFAFRLYGSSFEKTNNV